MGNYAQKIAKDPMEIHTHKTNGLLHEPTPNSTETTGRKRCQVVTTTHGKTRTTMTTKKGKNKKRQTEEPNEEDNKEYDNNVNEQNVSAEIHNNNEEEEEEDDDDNSSDDDNDNNNNDNNSPRWLLPNRTHNDLDVPSRKKQKKHIGNGIDEELATLQTKENLVSPTNLNSSHHSDNHKYDYHKYDMDLPVNKLDPFTTAAYVHKCVHEKLSPAANFSETTKMSISLWQWFLTKLEWEDLQLTTITSE